MLELLNRLKGKNVTIHLIGGTYASGKVYVIDNIFVDIKEPYGITRLRVDAIVGIYYATR